MDVRETKVQAMKAQIHYYQERVNQTIKEQNDVIICPNTNQVISKTQCNTCDPTQWKRCQMIMQESSYQGELAKIKAHIA